ncbi:hypothetical protein [Candidatus Palauibacter sp.]|uniref:hypothetical protein n=1 Tax=Candidatus Palauibacter sp. TaxID=3101350 RepID=UPI003D0DBE43
MGTRRSLTRLPWGIVPLLALFAPSTELNAQGLPDDGSPLAQVFDRILAWHRVLADPDDGDDHVAGEFPGGDGWGVVVGRLEGNEHPRYGFDVPPGYRYRFAAAGDDRVRDITLCLHDEEGNQIRCESPGHACPTLSVPRRGESAVGRYQVLLWARAERPALVGIIAMVSPLDDEGDAGTPTPRDPGEGSPPEGCRP